MFTQFALDEGLANNLSRLEELDKQADDIGNKLRDLSEEEVDSKVESPEDLSVDELKRELEELKVGSTILHDCSRWLFEITYDVAVDLESNNINSVDRDLFDEEI